MKAGNGPNSEDGKYELLLAVVNELVQAGPLDVKLDRILIFLDEHLDLKHTIILLPRENELKIMATRGYPGFSVGVRLPLDYGFVGAVAKNKKILKIPRLSQYRRLFSSFNVSSQLDGHRGDYPTIANAESLVVLPLISNEELVAVLSCESEDIMFFNKKAEDLLVALSKQIAISIQNSMVFDQLEERIERRTGQLQKANATKDRLFSIISHDVRSPLSALDGISGLINKYMNENDTEHLFQVVKEVDENAGRVRLLLDNLLSWSLVQQGEIKCYPQSIEIRPVLKQVFALFEHQVLAKDLVIDIHECEGFFAFVDYQMFFSILRNVLSNAIKFTKLNGSIQVKTKQSADNIEISIIDTGVGIPKGLLSKLFDPELNKSKVGTAREKGSGLGLVLVNEFVKMNSGSIDLQSSTFGTTVTISLPNG